MADWLLKGPDMSEKATGTPKNTTGSEKLQISATKPELPVSQLLDTTETKL